MKKILLIGALGLFSSINCSTMVNVFTSSSTNWKMNIGKLTNYGTIKGTEAVEIDAMELYNSGTITGTKVLLVSEDLESSGTISAQKHCMINTQRIKGDGVIESPKIILACDSFSFRGTLSCTDECTIFCKELCDFSLFKRIGSGKYKVVVMDFTMEFHTKKSFIATVVEYCKFACLDLTKDNIVKLINELRMKAIYNKLDDEVVMNEILTHLTQEAEFHRERLNENYDHKNLFYGSLAAMAGAACLWGSHALYKRKHTLEAVCLGMISTLPVVTSIRLINGGLYPRHKQKYEQYRLIIDTMQEALKNPRVIVEKVYDLEVN